MTIVTADKRELALAQLEHKLDRIDALKATFAALVGPPSELTPAQRLDHVEGLVRLIRIHVEHDEPTGSILVATAAQLVLWMEVDA